MDEMIGDIVQRIRSTAEDLLLLADLLEGLVEVAETAGWVRALRERLDELEAIGGTDD
jgi:hypothetical protein